MKSVFVTCVSTLLLSLIAAPAFANIDDIRAEDKAVTLEIGGSNLRYGESIDKTTFDTEHGWMPSIDVGLNWLTQNDGTWTGNTYLHLDGQASAGDVNYDGGVQVFDGTTFQGFPFSTNTVEQIYHVTGKIGHWFQLSDEVSLTPYLDVGMRGWQRSIGGGPFDAGGFGILTVGNTTETYQHYESGAGFLLQVSPISSLVLSASGQFGSTFGATMRSSGLTYNLGSRPVWQIGGGIGYAITPRLELLADARYDGFGYNKSALLQVGGGFVSREPDSYTHQLTLMGGLAYHLK